MNTKFENVWETQTAASKDTRMIIKINFAMLGKFRHKIKVLF